MNVFHALQPASPLAALLRCALLLAGLGAGTVRTAEAQTQAQTDPAGVWRMEDGKIQVQVLPQAGTWTGKIVALGPGVPTKDLNNPDPARRTRDLVGTNLFWNLRWDPAARKFTGGQLYSAERGREIAAEAWLDGRNTLRVQGHVLLLTRTITFHRVIN